MAATDPVTELDARFSSGGAEATPWADGQRQLETAELFWLATVRPDGRPHVKWHFDVAGGALLGDGGKAIVFRVVPAKGFGFKKGEYGQTRWLF